MHSTLLRLTSGATKRCHSTHAKSGDHSCPLIRDCVARISRLIFLAIPCRGVSRRRFCRSLAGASRGLCKGFVLSPSALTLGWEHGRLKHDRDDVLASQNSVALTAFPSRARGLQSVFDGDPTLPGRGLDFETTSTVLRHEVGDTGTISIGHAITTTGTRCFFVFCPRWNS